MRVSMEPIYSRPLLFALGAVVVAACALDPIEPRHGWSTNPKFPAIDPTEKYFKPGPVLATPDAVVRHG